MQQIESNDAKIKQAQSEQTGLKKQGVGVNDFDGQMQSNYVKQVDQMGTAAQNAGKAVDNGLNTAIQGTSNALDAVIFRTGSWKQAMGSAVRSGVQGLIELGVKTVAHYAMLGAQMIAHKILGSTLKTQDTTETVTQSATKVAALTPATLLESITSYGVAAAVGAAAMLAAFALVGGFESGGYTGGVAGQVAGVVHGEEYVLNAAATSAMPRSFLDALNSQRVSVASGSGSGSRAASSGHVSAFSQTAERDRQAAATTSARGGAPNIKMVVVQDEAAARRELLNSGDFDHAFVQRMDRHGVQRKRT